MTNDVFTPEQDNDKTTTTQMLNLCIPMMPFTPGPTNQMWKASKKCTGSTFVLSLSCSGVKSPLELSFLRSNRRVFISAFLLRCVFLTCQSVHPFTSIPPHHHTCVGRTQHPLHGETTIWGGGGTPPTHICWIFRRASGPLDIIMPIAKLLAIICMPCQRTGGAYLFYECPIATCVNLSYNYKLMRCYKIKW